MEDKLLIAREAKKTINYIEKNVSNFDNDYKILKDRIINALYDILELIYQANINQDRYIKECILVKIRMVNFYLKQSYDKKLISNKKYMSYSNHLLSVHNMIGSWTKYEKSK